MTKPEFIGSWTLASKSVDMSCWDRYREQHGNGLIFSSPADEWNTPAACWQKAKSLNSPKPSFG